MPQLSEVRVDALLAELEKYIAAAGIAHDAKGPLFRTVRDRSGQLTGKALWQQDGTVPDDWTGNRDEKYKIKFSDNGHPPGQ